MKSLTRFALVLAMLAGGVVGGIGLTAVLSGSPADDPCRGAGRLERKIVGPPEEGSKEFTVCTKPGQRVIFDAEGTPVDVTIREEELIEYYKTHPAENPRLIADQTADAELAENFFVAITPPAPPADESCPVDAPRTEFPAARVSLCMPTTWKVMLDEGGVLTVGDDEVTLNILTKGVTGTAGTKCARPSIVETKLGSTRICATPISPGGGQGHGLVFPGGREGGLSIANIQNEDLRDFAFQVAYSVREL